MLTRNTLRDFSYTFGTMRKALTALFAIVSILLSVPACAQSSAPSYRVLDTLSTEYYNSVWYVSENDTMAIATFSTVSVEAVSKNRSKKRQYDRFQEKVVKVYPYARAAGDIMKMYDTLCLTETDEKKREALLDRAEDELKVQFEKDLRKMTVSEGMILIKLIDRETGSNSFTLVQELKGKFNAFMWQSVARLFGHNLKNEYDAEGSDVWIESIVMQIEDGSIPVELRSVDPFGLKTTAAK